MNSRCKVSGGLALQVWARRLHETNNFAMTKADMEGDTRPLSLYLFPFQTDSGIQLLGFLIPADSFYKASLLQSRILLVLDLDETVITSHTDAGNRVRPPKDTLLLEVGCSMQCMALTIYSCIICS